MSLLKSRSRVETLMPGFIEAAKAAGGTEVFLDLGLTRQYGFTIPANHEGVVSKVPAKMLNALSLSNAISIWPMGDGKYMAGTLNTSHVYDSSSLYNFHGRLPGRPLTSIFSVFRSVAENMIVTGTSR